MYNHSPMEVVMSLRKTPNADLKSKWQLSVEVSAVLSLGILVTAFYFFPNLENKVVFDVKDQDLIPIELIESTTQKVIPPVPPRPMVPVVVSDDQKIIDDVPINIQLNVDAKVTDTPKLKEEYEEPINEFPEEFPEPIGGISAIQKKVEYPDIAKRVGLEGTVIIKTAIDENGNVIKTSILKSIGGGCDEAAIAAIEKTKFKPGYQMGRAVKVWMSIPIRFKLK